MKNPFTPFVEATTKSLNYTVGATLDVLSVTNANFTLAQLKAIKSVYPALVSNLSDEDLELICAWLEYDHHGFWVGLGHPKHIQQFMQHSLAVAKVI